MSIDTQGTSTHTGTRQHRPQTRTLSVACGSVTPGLWGGTGVWGRGVSDPGLQSVPLSKKGVPRRYYHTGRGAGQESWGLAGQGPALSPSLSGTSLSWEANWRAEGGSGPGSQACGLQQRQEKIKWAGERGSGRLGDPGSLPAASWPPRPEPREHTWILPEQWVGFLYFIQK